MQVGLTSIITRKWSTLDCAEGCCLWTDLIKYDFLMILSFRKWWILVAQFCRLWVVKPPWMPFIFGQSYIKKIFLCSPLQISFCLFFSPVSLSLFIWLIAYTDLRLLSNSLKFFSSTSGRQVFTKIEQYQPLLLKSYMHVTTTLTQKNVGRCDKVNKNRMKSFATITVFTKKGLPCPRALLLIANQSQSSDLHPIIVNGWVCDLIVILSASSVASEPVCQWNVPVMQYFVATVNEAKTVNIVSIKS